MTLKIEYIKPFYSKVEGDYIRLIFAYQYFRVNKDGEDFHFIPIEGKEVVLDKKKKEIRNFNDIFVFQRGNRFIRLSLCQLIMLTDFEKRIQEIVVEGVYETPTVQGERKETYATKEELEADLDYELGGLSLAMEKKDEEEITRCKNRLVELHKLLAYSK